VPTPSATGPSPPSSSISTALLIDSEPFWRQAEIEVFGSLGLHLSRPMSAGHNGSAHRRRRPALVGPLPVERDEPRGGRSGRSPPGWRSWSPSIRPPRCPEPWRLWPCAGGCPAGGGVLRFAYAVVIEAALRSLGIESEVSVWHSAEWEPLGKPHPGSYLSTAAKLGVDPVACLALEDSFNGAHLGQGCPHAGGRGSRGRGVRLAHAGDSATRSCLAGSDSTGSAAPFAPGERRRHRRFLLRNCSIGADSSGVRGAFPGQGGPSDVGPVPEAGR
jgi:hypothetical protein